MMATGQQQCRGGALARSRRWPRPRGRPRRTDPRERRLRGIAGPGSPGSLHLVFTGASSPWAWLPARPHGSRSGGPARPPRCGSRPPDRPPPLDPAPRPPEELPEVVDDPTARAPDRGAGFAAPSRRSGRRPRAALRQWRPVRGRPGGERHPATSVSPCPDRGPDNRHPAPRSAAVRALTTPAGSPRRSAGSRSGATVSRCRFGSGPAVRRGCAASLPGARPGRWVGRRGGSPGLHRCHGEAGRGHRPQELGPFPARRCGAEGGAPVVVPPRSPTGRARSLEAPLAPIPLLVSRSDRPVRCGGRWIVGPSRNGRWDADGRRASGVLRARARIVSGSLPPGPGIPPALTGAEGEPPFGFSGTATLKNFSGSAWKSSMQLSQQMPMKDPLYIMYWSGADASSGCTGHFLLPASFRFLFLHRARNLFGSDMNFCCSPGSRSGPCGPGTRA